MGATALSVGEVGRVLIYAHRGSSGVAPENSMEAFAQAVRDGADGVELDVRATADGVPVVLHDRGLERTTSGRGPVDGLTLAELRGVAAGDGRPVPTLSEVLAMLGGKLAIDLEIKQGGIEGEVLSTLRDFPGARWFISAFDWGVLRAVRRLAEAAAIWPLATVADEALFEVAAELGAAGVALGAEGVTAAVVERCRGAGLRVKAWTVNEVEEARRLREIGVGIVCTDVPGALRRGLRAVG